MLTFATHKAGSVAASWAEAVKEAVVAEALAWVVGCRND